MNPEIGRFLNSYVKKKDHYQKLTQSYVAASAVANLRLIDELTLLFKQDKIDRKTANTLLQLASDSTKMLAKGYSDISLFRKLLIKPHVQVKYQQLCGNRTHGSTLFGSDLAREIKSVDDESKIMKYVARPTYSHFQSSQYRMQPYNVDYRHAKNGQQRGRGAFRPPYPQYRSRRPYRGRPRAPATQTLTQVASQQ